MARKTYRFLIFRARRFSVPLFDRKASIPKGWDLYGFEAVRQRQSVGQSLCRTDPAGNGGSLGKELSVKRAAGCRDRST